MNENARQVSSLSSWARVIKVALEAEGVDALALFEQADMDAGLLADPNARFSLAQTTRLWDLAVEATGNTAFGLTVSSYVQQTSFHALGYSLIASASLKEAFERLCRYFYIVTNAADLSFVQENGRYVFRSQPLKDKEGAFAAQEAFWAVNLRMCRSLAGRDFKPLAVSLKRPKPMDVKPYQDLFGVDVEFEAATMAMAFDIGAIEEKLPSANEELALHNEAILERLLAGMSRDKLSQNVKACLIDLLSNGEPSQEQVASRLNMSARSLQRKLHVVDTSYSKLLDETRNELARDYLADDSYSISDITFLLGFSDTSSFSRACRRWTGKSPRAYREENN